MLWQQRSAVSYCYDKQTSTCVLALCKGPAKASNKLWLCAGCDTIIIIILVPRPTGHVTEGIFFLWTAMKSLKRNKPGGRYLIPHFLSIDFHISLSKGLIVKLWEVVTWSCHREVIIVYQVFLRATVQLTLEYVDLNYWAVKSGTNNLYKYNLHTVHLWVTRCKLTV